jgi:PAS domain S-box-containing protein
MGQAVDESIRVALAERTSMSELEQASHCLSPRALDLICDSVVVVNSQGEIVYLNSAAQQFFGGMRDELIGQDARTTLFADSRSAFDSAWRTTLNRGEWRGHIEQRNRHGVKCVIETSFSRVCDPHSPQTESTVIVSSEISNFITTAAGLAHEIRNPLASIKGVADAFLERRQLTRQERQWMKAVRREVIKLDARMRELLDVSQPRVLTVRQCLLSELIGNVVLLATHRARSIKDREGRKISIQFINATTKPLMMHLDPARIEDAVMNLVLNAIESIAGNGEVTICLRRSHKPHNSTNGDGEALVEVTDTGGGVPRGIRRHIFEPRFTTKLEGDGLGLAAVRRTAAAYHGRISFKTELGRGSKFVLALPLRSQSKLTEKLK